MTAFVDTTATPENPDWITLPAPGSYWRDSLSHRVIYVTSYHVEPSRTGRRPMVLVQFKTGLNAWEVGSCQSKVWQDLYVEAEQVDWARQEA